METKKSTYVNKAKRVALQVEFLETVEEFRLYYKAIYSAMLWGMK